MTQVPPAASPAQAVPAPAAPKRSGLAVASLVCGIVGPCTVGATSLAAIILGIVAIVRIGKSAGTLGGRGLAIAGTVLGGVFILLVPIIAMLAAILVPSLTHTRNLARATQATAQLHQLTHATLAYCAENRDVLPEGDAWVDALERYGVGADTLRMRGGPQAGRGYAMNGAVAGQRIGAIRRPGRTVLFYECAAGSPPAGGPDLLPPNPRFPRGYLIAFCDGHVERVPPQRVGDLIWDPKAPPAEP